MISDSASTSIRASASRPTPIAAAATATVPKKSSNLSQSAKISIGVGVPLGVLILAIFIFAILWYRKHTKKVTMKHPRDELARDPWPEKEKGADKEPRRSGSVKKSTVSRSQTGNGGSVNEIEDTEIAPYSRELQGSQGVKRSELSSPV